MSPPPSASCMRRLPDRALYPSIQPPRTTPPARSPLPLGSHTTATRA
jgi:hypothetical protein